MIKNLKAKCVSVLACAVCVGGLSACSVNVPVPSTTDSVPAASAEASANDDAFIWSGNEIQGLTEKGKKQKEILIPEECVSIVGMFDDGGESVRNITFADADSVSIAGAFANAKKLQTITLPENQTEIGSMAFKNSTLTEITIPDAVTSVGREAFSGCTKLTSVSIGANVVFVGKDAFSGCTKLQTISVVPGSWADEHFDEFAQGARKEIAQKGD